MNKRATYGQPGPRPRPENTPPDPPTDPITRTGQAIGTGIAWALIALVGLLIASGLIAGIAALWRVIL